MSDNTSDRLWKKYLESKSDLEQLECSLDNEPYRLERQICKVNRDWSEDLRSTTRKFDFNENWKTVIERPKEGDELTLSEYAGWKNNCYLFIKKFIESERVRCREKWQPIIDEIHRKSEEDTKELVAKIRVAKNASSTAFYASKSYEDKKYTENNSDLYGFVLFCASDSKKLEDHIKNLIQENPFNKLSEIEIVNSLEDYYVRDKQRYLDADKKRFSNEDCYRNNMISYLSSYRNTIISEVSEVPA